jgi:predicted NBD/HSP70 family sugar kinase
VTEESTRVPRGVASSETAREINRDIILHTTHRRQPVSRADLARLTGLQPSTVSVIIGDLIEEGWVLDGSVGRLPRGRRPTFVMLNERHATLAIDLRPDKANLAVVDINGKILSRKTVLFSAPKDSREQARTVILKIAKTARSLRKGIRDRIFQGTGVSVSGRVDQRTHEMLFSPNAPWASIDLYKELTAVLETPLEMENAANACLFGESWFGSLGDASNVIVISVAEGIGSGLLVDGKILRGRDDLAGEFGHMPFDDSGPACGCGNTGCWETIASNRAGLRYYKELVPNSRLVSFQELLDRAKAGEIKALRAIDKMAGAIARGLAIINAGLAPEVILIVGDCTALWSRICPILESYLIGKSFTARTPRLVPAMEGDMARLRGAAALVLHKVLFRRTELQ